MSAVELRMDVQSVIDPEGAVLLDLNRGTYFGLNEVAAEIWTRLKEGFTVAQIVEHVSSEFDVPIEEVQRDVDAFVAALVKKRLVIARE